MEILVLGVGVAVNPQSSASSSCSDHHMFPVLLLHHTIEETNVKLITSDGTTLTAPVLLKLKKRCDPWHPLSLWKVCVIVLQSVVHPRDALRRALQRGPRGTEWGGSRAALEPPKEKERTVGLLMRRKSFNKDLDWEVIRKIKEETEWERTWDSKRNWVERWTPIIPECTRTVT